MILSVSIRVSVTYYIIYNLLKNNSVTTLTFRRFLNFFYNCVGSQEIFNERVKNYFHYSPDLYITDKSNSGFH
jgi:hypothetical protein